MASPVSAWACRATIRRQSCSARPRSGWALRCSKIEARSHAGSMASTSIEVAATFLLGREIVGVVGIGRHMMGNALDHLDPLVLEPGQLVGIVRQQPHL